MKAVLIADSRDPRLNPFTLTRPACLLPIGNRSVLARNCEALGPLVDEISILAGEDRDAIQAVVGDATAGPPLSTTGASDVAAALGEADDECIVLNAHDWLGPAEVEALAAGACIVVDGEADVGGLGDAVEGGRIVAARVDGARLASMGAPLAERLRACVDEGVSVSAAATWRPLVYPWHIIEANVAYLQSLEGQAIDGEVEDFVTIKGAVEIGAGALIKAGTTIEGPVIIGAGTTVGPSAYIRPDTVIGEGCFIGFGFEIFDSVVFEGTKGKHRTYVGHSVIGAGVNIGCGFTASDYRHDGAKHVTPINGEKVQTGRSKLGVFIGDNVCTGVHTATFPGRKIWPGKTTRPGEIVERDVT